MLDRRNLLAGAAGLAALSTGACANLPKPWAAPAGDEDAKLDALLTRHFEENVDDSPEFATSLGLDKDARAPLRFRLDDRSAREAEDDRTEAKRRYAELRRIDRSRLTPKGALSFDIFDFMYGGAAVRADRGYGPGTGANPYVITQRGGAYQQIPDWLDTTHRIAAAEDAEAYLSRLEAFAVALDQQTGHFERDARQAGVVPPDFVLDKALAQLKTLRDTPARTSALVASVARRAKAAGIEGDWEGRATTLVEGRVQPALDRQIAVLTRFRPQAVHDAGVWRLPKGETVYAQALRAYTTTDLSADEIHRIGLEQVADLHARIDVILKAQGYTQGSVGERLNVLNKEPRFLYPNTDEGRAKLLASLNAQMADLAPRLPRAFATLPKTPVEIRRVPPSIELGASGGYYQRGSLDGTRPGAYYINLKDTHDWPSWGLPTLTYHEASPGHHFQISIMQEAGELPIYRRAGVGFSAYSEGWGLYAERVADELGVYENDPFGKVGYLQSYLFRAVRLVVDTGLHHKRWSREQAIRWMVDNAAEPEGSAEREIERYAVMPGQACSYKIGQTEIARLRAEAEAKLGTRFDIRAFHDVILNNGAMPLTVLERVVREWTMAA